jgi:hypothetical protein
MSGAYWSTDWSRIGALSVYLGSVRILDTIMWMLRGCELLLRYTVDTTPPLA